MRSVREPSSFTRGLSAVAVAVGLGVVIAGQTAPPPKPSSPAGQTPATPQRPVFRGGTNLVLVDAYPRRKDRIVEGLTAGDFEVYENGKLQTIQQFDFVRVGAPVGERPDATAQEAFIDASEPRSRVFIVYLDAFHVTSQGSRNMKAALVDLIDGAMAARDLFSIVTSTSPLDLRFGRAMLSMVDQLGGFGAWGLADGRIPDPNNQIEKDIAGCFDAGIADGLIQRLRTDVALENLERVVNYVGHIREARTFILVVSNGWSLADAPARLIEGLQAGQLQGRPGVGVKNGTLRAVDASAHPVKPCEAEALQVASIDLRARFTSLLDRAHGANVTFYPVDPAGLGVPDPAGPNRELSRVPGHGPDALLSLAHDTDGEALIRPDDFTRGIAAIGPDISAYYLLGYVSPNDKADGSLRTIRVRVKQPGVSVAHRRGYVAPTAEESAKTTALNTFVEAGPSPEFNDALGRLGRTTPDTTVLTDGVQWGEGGDLAVAVEVSASAQARGRWTRGAAVKVSVVDDRGARAGDLAGRIDAGGRSALIRVPMAGTSAVWRVVVQLDGVDGQFTDRLLVEEPHGVFLGDPLVYRATSAAQSALQPAVDGVFRRTERVHVEWPVMAAPDQRDVRLLDERGRPLALALVATERQSFGRPTLAVDLSLAPLSAGDYVIEVTAGKGKDTEQRFVAIRVGR